VSDQLLVNVLNVGPVAPGATVSVPHGLKAAGVGIPPTQVICDRASPLGVIGFNTTTITVENFDVTNPASASFRAEFDHSIHAVGAPTVAWQGYVPPYAPAGVAVYGQFSDTTDQPVASGGIAVAKFDTTDAANGVSVVNDPVTLRPTRLTVASAGVYAFTISPQIVHGGGGTVTIIFWPRIDGVDVPNSASSLEMGNNNNRTIPFFEFITPMTAGQYMEWVFYSSGNNTSLEHFDAVVGPPAIPAIPSVIAGVKLIGS
jgi:hypothetical protein